MALFTTGSGVEPVIAEVEMNAGSDPGATTVRATVVQASTVFYDTPATLGKRAIVSLPPTPPQFWDCNVLTSQLAPVRTTN
jgi:hypothetical protein